MRPPPPPTSGRPWVVPACGRHAGTVQLRRTERNGVGVGQHNPLWSSDWGWFEGVDGSGIIQLCGIKACAPTTHDYEAGWGFMPISEGLWNHFLEDDTYRRDVAIVSEDELAQDLEDAGAGCGPIIDITQNNPNDFTGYWQEYSNYKAYAGTNVNGGNERLTKAQNTHVFGYADVLLMLAEALHRGSGSDSKPCCTSTWFANAQRVWRQRRVVPDLVRGHG